MVKERWKMKHKQGFTIVELLIVIVVIAILAAITIVSYNGIQNRAKVAVITSGIKQVEDGFRAYMIVSGMSEYPKDNDFGGNNPTFAQMMAYNSDFAEHMPSSDAIGEWTYDNDKDSSDPAVCRHSDWSAVNIEIKLTKPLAEAVDKAIDDGNLACGKVRSANAAGTNITYKLSFDQKY